MIDLGDGIATLGSGNPREVLHKTRLGHAGSDAPVTHVVGWSVKD